MKHEAEEQLLKTLNGQLKGVPAITKEMLNQYQMSAIVLSILTGILFVVAVITTAWLAHFFYKKNEDHYGSYDAAAGWTVVIGGSVSLIMLIALSMNIVHAYAPIYSVVHGIFS